MVLETKHKKHNKKHNKNVEVEGQQKFDFPKDDFGTYEKSKIELYSHCKKIIDHIYDMKYLSERNGVVEIKDVKKRLRNLSEFIETYRDKKETIDRKGSQISVLKCLSLILNGIEEIFVDYFKFRSMNLNNPTFAASSAVTWKQLEIIRTWIEDCLLEFRFDHLKHIESLKAKDQQNPQKDSRFQWFQDTFKEINSSDKNSFLDPKYLIFIDSRLEIFKFLEKAKLVGENWQKLSIDTLGELRLLLNSFEDYVQFEKTDQKEKYLNAVEKAKKMIPFLEASIISWDSSTNIMNLIYSMILKNEKIESEYIQSNSDYENEIADQLEMTFYKIHFAQKLFSFDLFNFRTPCSELKLTLHELHLQGLLQDPLNITELDFAILLRYTLDAISDVGFKMDYLKHIVESCLFTNENEFEVLESFYKKMPEFLNSLNQIETSLNFGTSEIKSNLNKIKKLFIFDFGTLKDCGGEKATS